MKALADQLLKRIARSGGRWPLPEEGKIAKTLATWQAFRESDREKLMAAASWPKDRRYHLDPLPERIAESWATFLWGEDPQVEPAGGDADSGLLEGMLESMELAAELARGTDMAVAEGEVWLRNFVDLRAADYPLLEARSRTDIIPLWQGRRLLAAAVVDELGGGGRGSNQHTVWRHLEVHTVGRVENVLYRGTSRQLGQLQPLTAHDETRDLVDVWDHELPYALLERVPYQLGRDPRLGRSAYARIKDQLLDLNEASTVGAENMRLTAKRRVVVPASAIRPRPTDGPGSQDLVDRGDGVMVPARNSAQFDAGEDVLVADPLDRELGRDSQPFRVLEYSFDAEALIRYQESVANTAVTRIGMTPEWLGLPSEQGWGMAATGTALRLRLTPTSAAGGLIARPWDKAVPRRLHAAILLDQLGGNRGGFGRSWSKAEPPAVERGAAIPRDDVEDDRRHADNVTAGIESVEQSIRERHPDWDEEQVDDELDRIREDRRSSAPALFTTGNPAGGNDPPGGPEGGPEGGSGAGGAA